ncbi:hypothetical protein BV22DRAFT_989379, partial [Leucogyrophana mollusca]
RISDDLKEAALRMADRGYRSREITNITRISKSTLDRTRRRKHITGSVAKAQAIGRGRTRTLAHHDCQYLIRLARHNPTLFLDEYVRRLEDGRFLGASLATVHRTFERAGINVKHVQKVAAERNPLIRANYIRRISQYPANYMLCIDEVSKDERTYARLLGRSK